MKPLTRVLVVFGTRPEAIKLAPVVRTLKARPERLVVRDCATAQHRDMLDQVLTQFEIVPDIDLDLMQPNQTLSGFSSRVLTALDAVLYCARAHFALFENGLLALFTLRVALPGHAEKRSLCPWAV